jgi:hypothetical protein
MSFLSVRLVFSNITSWVSFTLRVGEGYVALKALTDFFKR